MITPTTIGEHPEAAAASSLPDLTALSELANQFFRALPGAAPGALPAVPAEPSSEFLPAAAAATAPPEGIAAPPSSAAIPSVPFAPPSMPSGPGSPYYFIGEASGYRPSELSRAQAWEFPAGGATRASSEHIEARSHELPGQAQLATLAESILTSGPQPTGTSRTPSGAADRTPGFYFLDPRVDPRGASGLGAAFDSHPAFDVHAIRRDFPILAEHVNGRPLVWFDNAATTQKPQSVLDRLAHFYAHENSNIHRAAHELAARATDAYEAARNKIARFLGARSSEEIVYVRGATEAINLVAQSWGRVNVRAGDEIIVSHLEHHANIVPWQTLAKETGARLRVIPIDDSGQILLEDYTRLLNERTRIVAVSQVSNALGTITPVTEITELAHRAGALVLIDGAQAVSHMRVNVQSIGADFYVFSGHKLFGPTGIGALFGRSELLNAMPPWQGGGNMIEDVTFERSTFQKAPARFEAGTGNIADAVGLGAAIDYIERIGLENIGRYEHQLLEYAVRGLQTVPGLRLIGTARDKASVQSFVLEGYRPEDVGTALNREGIAVRAGHHCAQPAVRRYGVEATVRPSFAFYNTCAEIDRMIRVLHQLAAQPGTGRR